MYKQKDIVIIPFPYSDLTGSKQRPALIISNELINKTEDKICCLITSNIHKDDIEMKNSDFVEGKLPLKSSVKSHVIFTINERIIKKKICAITKELHSKIITRLNNYLN